MSKTIEDPLSNMEDSRQRLMCACPKCTQRLWLIEDQLDAAEGWVRCSSCEQVFLALACLLDAQSASKYANMAWGPSEQGTGHLKDQPMLGKSSERDSHSSTAKPISIDEFIQQQSQASSKRDSDQSLPSQPSELSSRTSPLAHGSSNAWLELEHAREEVRVHPRASSQRQGWFLYLGLLVFLVVLPLVFTFRFKNEVAALYPGLKAPLVQMCQWLQCQVDWPRDLTALSIESSSLEKEELRDELLPNAQSKAKRYQYQLSLRIKNSFSYPLAAPRIKLTLLDERDQVLSEQLLDLPVSQDSPVIKPGGLNPFLLPLTAPDSSVLLPSGYRVELQ